MTILYYTSYLAFFAAFAFVTLSLASGLLYVSELIEEHSRQSKFIGEKGIYAIIALHVLLYLFDSLPLTHVAFSILCHLVYLQNFSTTWPIISLTSISFVASCALVIADHFLWFFHFSRLANYNNHARTFREAGQPSYSFGETATFFAICVWLAPLFLFLSLSANDNALPVSSAADPSTPSLSRQQPAPSRGSLFRSIVSEALPSVLSRKRKGTGEGLIAPHSPIPSSPSFHPSRFSSPPPPSPRAPSGNSDLNDSNFKLATPPRRSSNLVRRPVGELQGLGLKPSSSLGTLASS